MPLGTANCSWPGYKWAVKSTVHLATPPSKPVMVYDGDCAFCALWVRRWRSITGERVEYVPFQEPGLGARFPELNRDQLEAAVHLAETDGSVYSGAEAVFRALAAHPHSRFFLEWHEHSPGFARATEWGYRFIANHRGFFSTLTRLGWGRRTEAPRYLLVRWVFMRSLGLIYLAAFLSLWVQIGGLIGQRGILPAAQTMDAARHQMDAGLIGLDRYQLFPTLCWWGTSDGFLKFQCAAGALLAVLLIIGIAPAPCLFLLWLIYLSLATVCRDFLGFQWDNLLLEAGFLSIFFAPLQWVPRFARAARAFSPSPPNKEERAGVRRPMVGERNSADLETSHATYLEATTTGETGIGPLTPALSPSEGAREQYQRAGRPSRVVLWLLRWLLFRLMFQSGCVKWLSGDRVWRNLTALEYHYETQPLPTWIGWYAHQLPAWAQQACTAMMFGIELGLPFLIFAPRRLRLFACGGLALLQVLIFLTGNYCFFNLLTLALCVLLLDDAALEKWVPHRWPLSGAHPDTAAPFSLSSPKGGARPAGSTSVGPFEGRGEEIQGAQTKFPSPPPSDGTTQELPAERAPRFGGEMGSASLSRRAPLAWPRPLTVALACIVLLTSILQFSMMFRVRISWPRPWLTVYSALAPFRSFESYGLFAVITTTRREIIVEGSEDGVVWEAYEFEYKPGDVGRRPQFVAPHQPRLDWQMWFAALSDYRHNPWFINFCFRLLQGSPEVLGLLEHNPFPKSPPRYIRAVLYEYHFTDFATRRKTGAWWRREPQGLYLPPISLRGAKEE